VLVLELVLVPGPGLVPGPELAPRTRPAAVLPRLMESGATIRFSSL